MDNRQANINRFEAEMTKVTRDGVDKLMAFIRKSDMYAAPASTRFQYVTRDFIIIGYRNSYRRIA